MNSAFRLNPIVIFLVILLTPGCVTSSRPVEPMENINFSGNENQAVVMLATRVVAKGGGVGEPLLVFTSYDPKRKAIPADKPRGTLKRFGVGRGKGMFSNADRAEWGYHAMVVDPGTYIMAAAKIPSGYATSYSLNSIYFDVRAGEVLYIGDYEFSITDDSIVKTKLSRSDMHAKAMLKNHPNIKKQPRFFSYMQSGQVEMPAQQLIYQIEIDPSAK